MTARLRQRGDVGSIDTLYRRGTTLSAIKNPPPLMSGSSFIAGSVAPGDKALSILVLFSAQTFVAQGDVFSHL